MSWSDPIAGFARLHLARGVVTWPAGPHVEPPRPAVSTASTRRAALAAILVLGCLTGCGFAPVYGPGGAGGGLAGQVALEPPETEADYAFQRRIEDRLGRAAAARYRLMVELSTDRQDLGSTSTGETTRFRITGTAGYTLVSEPGQAVVATGRTDAFTGYSATGATVSTLAGERDARDRLMVLLADQVIDALILDLGTGESGG